MYWLRKLYDGVYKYTGNLQELWDAAMEETLAKPETAEQSSEATEMVEDVQTTQYAIRDS